MPRISLILLIAAFTIGNCFSQRHDSILIFKKDTSGIKPYFDIKQFVDSELYAWHVKNKGIRPTDNPNPWRSIAFDSDSSAGSFFSDLFYRTDEVRLPSQKFKTFYRFVWLASLSERHYIINMFDENQQLFIETKDLDAMTVVKRHLPKRKLRQFERLLERKQFWQAKLSTRLIGTDGSDWLLEGQKGGNYHFLYNISPRNGELMYLIGNWMIKNSDAKPLVLTWHGKPLKLRSRASN